MENFWMYRDALIALTESISAAKTRGDGGIYKTVSLETVEEADALARFFFDVNGFDVEVRGTNTPGHYGFFITWDD